jgi:glutamate synthase domain-containing protein 1
MKVLSLWTGNDEMCRLVAITSKEYLSPIENILALETMKEGHDGSGTGLVLKGLGGVFSELRDYPILSGIGNKRGIEVLDSFMKDHGFKLLYEWSPKINSVPRIRKRGHYFARVYEYPNEFLERKEEEKDDLLLRTRVFLRRMGQDAESLVVFSFYPDILTLKEVGDPIELCDFFNLQNEDLKAKIILAQGRQNTNYSINLYACHPFFIQGFSTMTNGENTAFVPIREFLTSRGFLGYSGYDSDSEVFTHILHYIVKRLGLPLQYYKDVITPLKDSEMEKRKDRDVLALIKKSLRFLVIDGPNCVIGFTPEGTCFMVQDSKKLRPGVAGGIEGKYCLASEVCALDRVIPEREREKDIYPMKYEMIMVPYGAEKVLIWNQLKGDFLVN